jgi:hypothetical protein
MKTQITTDHSPVQPAIQQPTTTLAAFSVGSAVDLAKFENEFCAWLKTPWRYDEIAAGLP